MSQFETWFDGFVRDAMRDFVEDMAEDVRGSISQDCPQFHQHAGGHSPAGAPPYLETGRLQKSITSDARIISVGNIEGSVSTDVSYAAGLENGAHPFMNPAAVRAARYIAASLTTGLISRLPVSSSGTASTTPQQAA